MDTMKDTTMQLVTDVIIAEFKRAAEHPAKAPIIVRADAMLCVLARIEQLESDLATAEQDSRQKQARIDRLEAAEKEANKINGRMVEVKKRLQLIVEEPSNTMSTAKAMREMLRQANLALNALK